MLRGVESLLMESYCTRHLLFELDHEWQVTAYTWSQDNTAVTASFVCIRDDSHIHEETVGVHRIATVSPTQTDEGIYKLVSNPFETAGCEPQEKDGGTIPALGTLNALKLPASLRVIESEAFEGLPFQAVVIPSTCTTIGSRAFANCKNLIYVYIPSSVTSVASDVFSGCSQVIVDRATE